MKSIFRVFLLLLLCAVALFGQDENPPQSYDISLSNVNRVIMGMTFTETISTNQLLQRATLYVFIPTGAEVESIEAISGGVWQLINNQVYTASFLTNACPNYSGDYDVVGVTNVSGRTFSGGVVAGNSYDLFNLNFVDGTVQTDDQILLFNPGGSDEDTNCLESILQADNTATIDIDGNGDQFSLIGYSNIAANPATGLSFPIQLVDFSVSKKNEAAHLFWLSASEVNASHYDIERSYDGKSFEKIGAVEAKNSLSGSRYSFIDAKIDIEKGQEIFYRLKMVDFDGSYEHSPIRSITMDGADVINVYPNPFVSTLKINGFYSLGRDVSVHITAMDGSLVKSMNPETEMLDLGMLSPGSYFIKIEDESGEAYQEKIIKLD